ARDAAYWAAATRGLDFSDSDRVPPGVFNEIMWKGMKGGKPFPAVRSAFGAKWAGAALRGHRDDDK
ncbi:MAG: hypothetical protein FWD17_09035, partial [Polyangiaceae bacterium]|nr:hypothetical protein [Polyangiaceae bacterium]